MGVVGYRNQESWQCARGVCESGRDEKKTNFKSRENILEHYLSKCLVLNNKINHTLLNKDKNQ